MDNTDRLTEYNKTRNYKKEIEKKDKEIERLKKVIELQKRLMACWRLQDHRKADKILTELEALKDK